MYNKRSINSYWFDFYEKFLWEAQNGKQMENKLILHSLDGMQVSEWF